MSSFTRTIPAQKGEAWVLGLLSRRDDVVPLTFRPTRAEPGDRIYLIFRGLIIGRATIRAIEPAHRRHTPRPPRWARWVVYYAGGWERPPRAISAQGHQGVRYLEAHDLQGLDLERWLDPQENGPAEAAASCGSDLKNPSGLPGIGGPAHAERRREGG